MCYWHFSTESFFSFLPWFEIFYRLLNLLAEILNRTESNHVRPVLEALFKHHVPSSGEKVELLSHDPKQVYVSLYYVAFLLIVILLRIYRAKLTVRSTLKIASITNIEL